MEPSSWLIESARWLPTGGRALDVACGRGRHALWLAAAGFEVTAIDRDREALAALQKEASSLGVTVHTRQLDLEGGEPSLGDDAFDLVVVFRYLHRPLFGALQRALRPGGVLVYETFTRAQAVRGHPTNPAFLLDPGELPRLVAPLLVLAHDEGEREGSFVARVVARRPLDLARD
ncbi:MAG TPA: class I SAM-dependent methyltransferase [Vicinamibacteria bacterium]|nr:class I SAM-dependent methyltransferase [Vicinamibacteria bacterium]